MAENQERRCQECGAVLLPKRRFCVACSAHVSAVGQEQADRLTDILREMPSTHEPDKTIVFVPEYREARLKRERRDKRLMVSALVACLVLLVVSLAVWRLSPRKKSEVPKQQRETMAKRDLDLYAKAFEYFRSDIGRYPTVQEGLGSLLKRPGGMVPTTGMGHTSKPIIRLTPGGTITFTNLSAEPKDTSCSPSAPKVNQPGDITCTSVPARLNRMQSQKTKRCWQPNVFRGFQFQ